MAGQTRSPDRRKTIMKFAQESTTTYHFKALEYCFFSLKTIQGPRVKVSSTMEACFFKHNYGSMLAGQMFHGPYLIWPIRAGYTYLSEYVSNILSTAWIRIHGLSEAYLYPWRACRIRDIRASQPMPRRSTPDSPSPSIGAASFLLDLVTPSFAAQCL